MKYRNPEAYQDFMGRWSARLAGPFLDFAELEKAARLLDVGCGTGVLCELLRGRFPEAEIVGVDPTEEFIAHARATLGDARTRFEVAGADSLPFADDSFDAALALLILQELSEPEQAAAEMSRVVRPGGTVATSQWDFVDGLPMVTGFWDAVVAVHPPARAERDAGGRMPRGCGSEDALAAVWRAGGLVDVETATLTIEQYFASFEDYWTPFLGGATPTSSYAAALPPEVREAVATDLERTLLGGGPDGPFTLEAHAFTVRGRVPGA